MPNSPNGLERLQQLTDDLLAPLRDAGKIHPLAHVPPEYADHPLLKNQLFSILPRDLLEILKENRLADRFDPELWKLEKALAEQWNSRTMAVGFWNGKPIRYDKLRPELIELEGSDAQTLGMTEADRRNLIRVARERLGFVARAGRGYCGWLTLNPLFLEEQADFLRTWAEQIAQWGTALSEVHMPPEMPYFPMEGTDHKKAAFDQANRQFLTRWRLRQCTAPDLPDPLMPQLPVLVPNLILGYLKEAGTILYYPDTFPIPSREEFRQILEECADRSHGPDHLRGWQRLVQAGKTAKGEIPHLGRLFDLQHFWRVLHQRHGQALKGCKETLEKTFASFLGARAETIRRDLRQIKKRVGQDWVTRPFLGG